jgi:hypothetical protein
VIRINFGAQDSELILQVLKLGVELLLDQFQLDKYHDSSIRIFIRECKVKVTAMYTNVYTAYRVRCSLERPGYKTFVYIFVKDFMVQAGKQMCKTTQCCGCHTAWGCRTWPYQSFAAFPSQSSYPLSGVLLFELLAKIERM